MAEGTQQAGSDKTTIREFQVNVPEAELAELRRREFYEKPTQERKRKKAAAVKRHMKRVSRDFARPAR